MRASESESVCVEMDGGRRRREEIMRPVADASTGLFGAFMKAVEFLEGRSWLQRNVGVMTMRL